MDNRTEVRDFLASRRARISPNEAGLPSGRHLALLASWPRNEQYAAANQS
jgi:hypothetical protein